MKTPLFFLFLALSFSLFCQNEQLLEKKQQKTTHLVGISMGVNDFHLRDEYLSPHIFSKPMFSSGLTYQVQSKKLLQEVDLSYSFGHPDSNIQIRDVTEKTGFVSYSILHTFFEKKISGNPVQLSLGTGISSFIAHTNFIGRDEKYKYDWDEQSWYTSNSINLLFRSEHMLISGKSFFLQVTMPFFSLISRPENGHVWNDDNLKVINSILQVESQGKPEFFFKNPVFFSQIGYKQPIGKNFDLRFNYQFNYISSNRPLPLKMYMNQFMTQLDFLF